MKNKEEKFSDILDDYLREMFNRLKNKKTRSVIVKELYDKYHA